jgi:hypothetical protein
MESVNEPLGGLIEVMAWDEAGNAIARFRYYSMAPHRYGNGHVAGQFVDGVYTCALPDGTKVVQADGADGSVRVTVLAEDGSPAAVHRTAAPDGRCVIEAASGRFFAQHANGSHAVVATFSQAMYDAWGVAARVSPRAALSTRTHAAFRERVEPWLDAAASKLSGSLRAHAERGLAALRASTTIEAPTVLALLVLFLPDLDHEASVLCHLLMSDDAGVRARADAVLGELGPDTARAAVRLALMRQEDRHDGVRAWTEAALLRLGRPGLEQLQAASANAGLRGSVQPAARWLEAELGGG